MQDLFSTSIATLEGKVTKIPIGRFGAQKIIYPNKITGVLKTKISHDRVFRGVPYNEFHLREVAAYRLSQFMGFNLIPETVLIKYKDQEASVQKWIEGNAAKEIIAKSFKILPEKKCKKRLKKLKANIDMTSLRKLVILDLIINNTDRHTKNCLFDTNTRQAWGIDHGATFTPYFKFYRNTFHKRLFPKYLYLWPNEREKLQSITKQQLELVLSDYVSPELIEHTNQRIQLVLEQENLGFEVLKEGMLRYGLSSRSIIKLDKPTNTVLG